MNDKIITIYEYQIKEMISEYLNNGTGTNEAYKFGLKSVTWPEQIKISFDKMMIKIEDPVIIKTKWKLRDLEKEIDKNKNSLPILEEEYKKLKVQLNKYNNIMDEINE